MWKREREREGKVRDGKRKKKARKKVAGGQAKKGLELIHNKAIGRDRELSVKEMMKTRKERKRKVE